MQPFPVDNDKNHNSNDNDFKNKKGKKVKENNIMELFENAPPYMIIRISLKGGLYLNAGQTSKFS